MTRDELLKPGGYVSIPKALAADTRIGATAKVVWSVIADRLGNNAVAWPGEPTIARDAGIALNSVKRSIECLLNAGWLTVTRRAGKSNRYVLADGSDPAQIGPGQVEPGQSGLGTRPNLGLHPAQNGLTTRPNLGSELPNITTEEKQPNKTTQEEAAVAAPIQAASPSSSQAVEVTRYTSEPASRTKAKLTNEQVILAVTSDRTGAALTAYLLHGADAIGRPASDWPSLKPERLHWAPTSRSIARPDPGCSAQQLAGYVTFKLCEAMVHANEPLRMLDFGKLAKTIKTILKRQSQDELVAHVDRITGNWAAIKLKLAWMDLPPALDELMLNNHQVMDLSRRIAAGQSIAPSTQAASPHRGTNPQQQDEWVKSANERINRNLF